MLDRITKNVEEVHNQESSGKTPENGKVPRVKPSIVAGPITWIYRDASGSPIGEDRRFEMSDGGKEVIPCFVRNGKGFDKGLGDYNKARPVYGQEQLTSGNLEQQKGAVFFVEGCKCAEQIKDLGLIGLSVQGGVPGAQYGDYSPFTNEHIKRIYLLPDMDDAGKKYINDAKIKIAQANPGAKLYIVRLPLPEDSKQDIVDWVEAQDKVPIPELRKLLKSVIEVRRVEVDTKKALAPKGEVKKRGRPKKSDEHKNALLAALTLEAIAARYGKQPPDARGKTNCWFHEDGTASMQNYPESNRITCFGTCGFKGDYLAVIAKLEGLDCTVNFPAVLKIAESITGIEPPRVEARALSKLDSQISKKVSEKIKEGAGLCPDTQLRDEIGLILTSKEPGLIKHQYAKTLLIDWLNKHGYFVRSEGNNEYYFYEKARRLYDLRSEDWLSWLYSLIEVNPSGVDYRGLRGACQCWARCHAAVKKVMKVAYFDTVTKTLYVSRFDGTVYRFDGSGKPTEEGNGESVLFADDPATMQPYEPDDKGGSDWFHDYAFHKPRYEETEGGNEREVYSLIYETWLLQAFFMEKVLARPILLWYGEKGSGKSTNVKISLMNLFGPNVTVMNAPAKEEDFIASASSSHIYCLDNLDKLVPWMQDRLATLSTGSGDDKRKLFTTNESLHISYRCLVTITSRQPTTLRRDDLADRSIVLPVVRLPEGQNYITDSRFYADVMTNRNRWWGSVFKRLNQIVLAIREDKLKTEHPLRMSEFGCLGDVYAETQGKQDIWKQAVKTMQAGQNNLLLEGDIICEALDKWFADSPSDVGTERTARQLEEELVKALFGDKKPTGWFRSVKSFANRLGSIKSNLAATYGLDTRLERNKKVYWFEPPDNTEQVPDNTKEDGVDWL